ncbi:MAG: Macro domain protein [Verrucomicrobiales bacterium]|nr:Macro domain protein [Verrucomicrobiales bacterium]
MIHEVTGDILLTEAEAIAHGIAPNDHFDSGLALSLREQRPALYKDFRHYLHTNHPKTGGLWVWGGSGGKRIINLFTQEPAPNEHAKPGQATYANLNHCLHELQKLVVAEGIKSLALPRLATGVGGLAWDQVWPVLQSDLGSLKIPIFIYSHYQKGVKAVEEGT